MNRLEWTYSSERHSRYEKYDQDTNCENVNSSNKLRWRHRAALYCVLSLNSTDCSITSRSKISLTRQNISASARCLVQKVMVPRWCLLMASPDIFFQGRQRVDICSSRQGFSIQTRHKLSPNFRQSRWKKRQMQARYLPLPPCNNLELVCREKQRQGDVITVNDCQLSYQSTQIWDFLLQPLFISPLRGSFSLFPLHHATICFYRYTDFDMYLEKECHVHI